MTPLHDACRFNEFEATRGFLARGADPKVENHNGETLIAKARKLRHAEIVELLMDYTQE